jgi:acyl-CoA thioesterase-1
MPTHAASRCKAPQELVKFNAPLRGLSDAFATKHDIRIVALGSSSTSGSGASNAKACYPSRLEVRLNERYPEKHFEVLNLGVGGQLASQMLPRISSQVLPLKPSLVIWQTGVNDAIRGVEIETFQKTLEHGIDELLAARIDVILVDMQYYPRSEHVIGYHDYLAVMREVAKANGIPVLHRFEIMKYWVTSAQYMPEQFLAPDGFHSNDLAYGCLADVLADSIHNGLGLHAHTSRAMYSSR